MADDIQQLKVEMLKSRGEIRIGMLKHTSERYKVEDYDTESRNNIFLMRWGAAWSALRKSWKLFKQALYLGDIERQESYMKRINNIRLAMGLEGEELT